MAQMAQITIELNVKEAEEILTGLEWRRIQKGRNAGSIADTIALMTKVGYVFENALGAAPEWAARISKQSENYGRYTVVKTEKK